MSGIHKNRIDKYCVHRRKRGAARANPNVSDENHWRTFPLALDLYPAPSELEDQSTLSHPLYIFSLGWDSSRAEVEPKQPPSLDSFDKGRILDALPNTVHAR